jgi:rod shape-determining protein MreB
LHRAIRSAVVAKYKVVLRDRESERLVDEAVSFFADRVEACDSCEMTGVDVISRRTVKCFIRLDDAVDALAPVVQKIIGMIERSLAGLPDADYCSIIESGILLTGGGACIRGIDKLIEERTNIDVRIAPDPIHAVIKGAVATLDYWKEKRNWWEKISWPINHATATS